MRFIKAFLVGATALFIIITLLSLLIPFNAPVSRTVLIDADRTLLYNQVADLKNWKNWHPLLQNDSVEVRYGMKTRGAGAICDITFKNKHTQLLVIESDSNSVSFILTSKGENDISNQLYLSAIPGGHQTRVDWNSVTHLHWYPWEKFYAIFINQITGPGYEAALNGLKAFAERK